MRLSDWIAIARLRLLIGQFSDSLHSRQKSRNDETSISRREALAIGENRVATTTRRGGR